MIGQAVAAATDPRVVRLDSLTSADQRRVVLALVQTMKTAPAVSETSAGAVMRGVGHGRPSAAT